MFELIWDSLPRLLSGIVLTIEITTLSVAIGLTLAIPLAILYLAKNPIVSMLAQHRAEAWASRGVRRA